MEVRNQRKGIQVSRGAGAAQEVQETQEEPEGLSGEAPRDGCQLALQVILSRSFVGLLERH